MHLDALEDMRVVPEDGIGAGRDRGARHFALVVGDDGAHEVDAPVMRYQHHIGLLRARRGCRPASPPGLPHAPRCGCAPACRAGRARSARTACARASARSRDDAPRPSRPAAGSRNRRGRPRACRRPAVRITGRRAAAMFSPAPTTAMPASSRWRSVSKKASLPQSRQWLPAKEITSKPARASAAAHCGLRHHGVPRLRQPRAARGESWSPAGRTPVPRR